MKAFLEFIWDKSPWWIKCLMVILCAPLGVAGIGIGAFMTVDEWVVGKANTVVAPVRTEFAYFKNYSKEHTERVERELLMIRSQNDELKNILIKRSN